MSDIKYLAVVWEFVLGYALADTFNDKAIYKNDLIRRLVKRVGVLEASNRAQQQLLQRLELLLYSRENAHMELLNRVIALEDRDRARDKFQENQPEYIDELKTKPQDQMQEHLTGSVKRGDHKKTPGD
jgi:hypothetical protein